jgi:hypothetical protein
MILGGLLGVMIARPWVPGVLQMVSEPTLAVSWRTGQGRGSVENDIMAYGSGTWVHTHDAWVLWEGHSMVHMLLTRHTVCVC